MKPLICISVFSDENCITEVLILDGLKVHKWFLKDVLQSWQQFYASCVRSPLPQEFSIDMENVGVRPISKTEYKSLLTNCKCIILVCHLESYEKSH